MCMPYAVYHINHREAWKCSHTLKWHWNAFTQSMHKVISPTKCRNLSVEKLMWNFEIYCSIKAWYNYDKGKGALKARHSHFKTVVTTSMRENVDTQFSIRVKKSHVGLFYHLHTIRRPHIHLKLKQWSRSTWQNAVKTVSPPPPVSAWHIWCGYSLWGCGGARCDLWFPPRRFWGTSPVPRQTVWCLPPSLENDNNP